MLFSSPVFFVFFVAYFTVHLLIPGRWQIYLIIGGSTIFYAWWKLEYVWLPYLLMAIAYFGVIWMMRAKAEASRKRRAALAIVLLFVPLVVFKYTNFFYNDVFGPLTGGGKMLDLTLPLGVSFVTFTLTAYIVDIYRGKFPAGTSPLAVLGYVLFFPHLIAGPILRPIEFIPQLEHPRRAKSLRPTAGFAVFTIGLVKKLVFADTIAGLVDAAYGHTGLPTAPEALLAIYGFSVQIYCDFSGYTDMAIGLALLLGLRLPNNFRQPYCAGSIIDFWRRWHITLSFWLRDYLYIPLGGNREGRVSRDTQHHDHDDARRPLARRKLDLRHLGRVARDRGIGAARREKGTALALARPRTALGRRAGDISFRHRWHGYSFAPRACAEPPMSWRRRRRGAGPEPPTTCRRTYSKYS